MNPDLLAQLLAAPDSVALGNLLSAHHLTLTTIQWLKDHSAQFYATETTTALRIAQLAYDLSQSLPAPAPALGCWALGNAFMFLDRHAEADQLLRRARTEYLALGNPLDAARLGVTHVFVLAYLGQSEAALALATEIEPILTQSAVTEPKDLERLGGLLLNSAVAYELSGQYEETLEVYARLIRVAETLEDQLMLAQAQLNRGYMLAQIGSWSEAMAAYQLAEQYFLTLHAPDDLIRLHTNAAALLLGLEKYGAARQRLDLAAQVVAGGEHFQQYQHWLLLCRTLIDLQAQSPVETETLAQLQVVLQTFSTGGVAFAAGLTWVTLGCCHLHRQEWEGATAAFTQALDHAEQYADRVLKYRALHGLGQVAAAQNQVADATHAYQQAIEQIESIRDEFQIELFRADFLTDKLAVYQDLVRLYVHSAQIPLAFAIVERAKSRLLTEKLLFRLGQEAAALPAGQDEQIDPLTAQLRQTLEQLHTHYRLARIESLQADPLLGNTPSPAVANTLTHLEQQVQTLTHQIQRRQPIFSSYATGEPVALARVQSLLHDHLLLQYHINHGEVWVFLVSEAGILGQQRLAPLAEVEQARQQVASAVEYLLDLSVQYGLARAVRYLPTLLAEINQPLHTLFQLLLQPVAALWQTYSALVIVPDQTLHSIPFHALFDGQRYLLESHTLSYAPSATVLSLAFQPPAQGRGALLLGYDPANLAAISQEMTTLQGLLPGADYVTGAACQTAFFLERAAHYRLLHLSTHARFRLANPLLSALTLADRPLTLAEIAQLRLNAELVVLSACETGHGQLRGVDLVSLAGGFLSAGARSLLVSLWRVEDQATARLMATFYRALLAGDGRAAALRSAQLELLQAARQSSTAEQLYCHPAYWAPFTLLGNWSALPDVAGVVN